MISFPQKAKATQNNDDVIVIDATKYVCIVCNDPFHPGALHTVLIDPASVTSSQMMGYGELDGTSSPVVRLIYENGMTEDVFDVGHAWSR